MLEKGQKNRNSVEMVNIDMLVPEDHLLRKIDAAIDFTKIYGFVEDLYSQDTGRPSVDPVVLFKIVLIQHIYGIPSLRRTLEDIRMNLAYRWFLGYGITDPIPHFSTVSYNFRHRFTSETVEYVFRWILKEAAEAGYLDTEAAFVDGTHIKASANLKKQIRKEVPKEAKRYAGTLMKEVNADREEHGKSRLTTMIMVKVQHPLKQKPSVKAQPTRTAAFSTRASTKSALLMRRIPPATGTIL